MTKSKWIFYYLITQATIMSLVCILYFFGDVYFGYELGDIIIIFTILGIDFFLFFLLFFYKKMPEQTLYLFIFLLALIDVWIFNLFINKP